MDKYSISKKFLTGGAIFYILFAVYRFGINTLLLRYIASFSDFYFSNSHIFTTIITIVFLIIDIVFLVGFIFNYISSKSKIDLAILIVFVVSVLMNFSSVKARIINSIFPTSYSGFAYWFIGGIFDAISYKYVFPFFIYGFKHSKKYKVLLLVLLCAVPILSIISPICKWCFGIAPGQFFRIGDLLFIMSAIAMILIVFYSQNNVSESTDVKKRDTKKEISVKCNCCGNIYSFEGSCPQCGEPFKSNTIIL